MKLPFLLGRKKILVILSWLSFKYNFYMIVLILYVYMYMYVYICITLHSIYILVSHLGFYYVACIVTKIT